MTVVREAAVAGQFYPREARELSTQIQAFFDAAGAPDGPAPKALIVPHAAYCYSGQVAASAYARLRRHSQRYTRVVLLGPCHWVAVRGLAMSAADVFRTPLGDIPLDKEAIENLAGPHVRVFEATHQLEHSLEVHLPFLQTVIASFSLVPLVVGDVDREIVADVIDALWDGPETLIIASSDLSHYLPYDSARATDQATCKAIERLEVENIDHAHACGATPVGGLLIASQRHGLNVTTLDLRNSGDTSGDKNRVVGYGAWMLCQQ